ncbi:MAG TPA: energy transducer TonB [Candidatus Sulfotelmatobacter sp.]
MACFDGSVKRIEAEVTELVTAPSADASLFTPPTGAAELGRCFSKIEFPARAFTPEPDFPRGELQFGKGSSVELSLIVDKQGKSQDVRINESGGKQFDEVALKTVRQWRFKPATCDGEPMAQKIGVNVGFHLR